MGFRNPSGPPVTVTGSVDVTGSEVTTGAGSQTTTSGDVGWSDPPLIATAVLAGPGATSWTYCGARAGLYIIYGAAAVDQRVNLQFADWAGGTVRGEVDFHVRAGQVSTFFAHARAQWFRVESYHAGAGGTWQVIVTGTDRPLLPGSYLNPGSEVLLSTGFVSIGAGLNRVDYFAAPYTGPALISWYTDALLGKAFLYVVGRTYAAGTDKTMLIQGNDKAASFNVPIFLPPLILRAEMYNLDGAARNFFVAITPSGPR